MYFLRHFFCCRVENSMIALIMLLLDEAKLCGFIDEICRFCVYKSVYIVYFYIYKQFVNRFIEYYFLIVWKYRSNFVKLLARKRKITYRI